MTELLELGLLSQQEADGATDMEFNPVRVGFHGGHEVGAGAAAAVVVVVVVWQRRAWCTGV
jgi:hypothetical protein